MFQSDFRFVAKYFQSKRKNEQYVPTPEEISHKDELMKMFTVLTGEKLFETFYNKVKSEGKGGFTMCDVVEGFKAEGKKEERAELIRTMLEEKFATEEQIAKLLKISVEEVKKISQKVPVMN